MKDYDYETLKKISLTTLAVLSLVSFSSSAQSITVVSSTLDGAQAKIAAQAHALNEHYKILEANTNNWVHMTAEIYK
ncbi:DUF1471 domain-containing protein [Pantoea agglomerans]|uniref:DUF1471 domain-containing protein n=1 Tax=Enterobacter agglomerans TaxID=549 RepID=UPI000F03443C|nr:DUF1471 domain-containing protein [Pantoea agglomerans]AYP25797.1 DUF1471 domain-containing protein [Pantoea agglomerans]